MTGLSTTGSNVFEGRVFPIEESKLPCLLVYDSEEEIEAQTLSPAGSRSMMATLNVVIEGYANGGDGATVLDEFYYKNHKEEVIANADQVALIFNVNPLMQKFN